MKAIILAGGKGTRLSSVISDLPKPLALVQGEPFLFKLLRFLHRNGVEDILVSIHHLSGKFKEMLPAMKKLTPRIALLKEPIALGTGGAVRFACENLPPEQYVLVLNGDTFFAFDLSGFLAKHGKHTALALREIADASRYGNVCLKNGNIQTFAEKRLEKKPGLIYAGFAILNVSDLKKLLPEGPSSLEKDFFSRLLKTGASIRGEVYPGAFIDIGVPEDYRAANANFDFSEKSPGDVIGPKTENR